MLPTRLNQVIQAMLAAGVVLTAVFTTITVANGTFTNLTATNAAITTANVTSVSSTGLIVGQGTNITKHLNTTFTVNPSSMANGAATSSLVTLTGATTNGSVFVTRTGSWAAASSTANIFAVPGTDSVTLYFQNNSSTAVDLSNSTYILDFWAH